MRCSICTLRGRIIHKRKSDDTKSYCLDLVCSFERWNGLALTTEKVSVIEGRARSDDLLFIKRMAGNTAIPNVNLSLR